MFTKICETKSHKSTPETFKLDRHSATVCLSLPERPRIPDRCSSGVELEDLANHKISTTYGPLDIALAFLREVWVKTIQFNTLIQDLSEHRTYRTIGEWTFVPRKSLTITVQTLINLWPHGVHIGAYGKWRQNHFYVMDLEKLHRSTIPKACALLPPWLRCDFLIWDVLGPKSLLAMNANM